MIPKSYCLSFLLPRSGLIDNCPVPIPFLAVARAECVKIHVAATTATVLICNRYHGAQDDLSLLPYPTGRSDRNGTRPISWFILFIAGLFDVIWAIGLKYTQGFTRPFPSLIGIGTLCISFLLLAWAMKTLPAGTAYAVWSAVGAALVGMSLLGEAVTAGRVISLCLLIAGIAGLK